MPGKMSALEPNNWPILGKLYQSSLPEARVLQEKRGLYLQQHDY